MKFSLLPAKYTAWRTRGPVKPAKQTLPPVALSRLRPIARVPAFLSSTPGAIRRHAPTLGEHTDAILSELGYDESAIAGLRAERHQGNVRDLG